tara:strand:+ start:3352 stop:6606 length:3255 start_codon:yes stop_codon:yes gene_type:complete
MVKNIPTIERSTKIRFGKHVSDSQAENTIVFNASNTEISTPNSGSIYISPLRVEDVQNANFFAYNSTTKEVVDSGVKTSLLGGITLQEATARGNSTSNTVQFTNSTTGFITTSNVGISNSAPTHALSVKDKIFMCGSSTTLLDVKGTSKSERIISGTNITIDGVQTGTNPAYITTGGRTHSTRFTGTTLGLAGNLVPTDTISLGNDPSSVKINVPTQSTNAFWTSGNVYAQKYLGDGSLLDNITMDVVSRKLDGNILSIPIESSNIITGIKTLGNVQVDTTHGSFLGKIAGSNTISASTISATSISTTSAILSTSGGTGYSTYESGAILYGKSDNSLGKLDPASSNEDVGKFLKLGTNDVPTWSEVSSNLESIVSNGPATANITSNTIQFRNEATSLMTTGNIVVETNVYAEEFVSTNIPIASTSGGTGHKIITKGDILYGNHDSDNTLGRLIRAGDDSDRGKFLKLGTNDIPTWSEVSSNLESIVSNGPATANITSNILQFSQGIKTKDITIGSGSQINDTFIPYLDSGSKLLKSSKISYNDTDKITSISSNVVIGGNLTVQGNTTHEHTTDHFITDKIFGVASGNDQVSGGDTMDMGQHMARPTANVFAGYLGASSPNEYTICFTRDASTDTTISPYNGSGYITANVWGNVLAGNVTTAGIVEAHTLKGRGGNITELNPDSFSSQILINKGGTGLTSVAQNELLLGPASGTALTKLSPYNTDATKKFLRSNASGIAWDDVSSNLESIVNNGPTSANITSNVIQFSGGLYTGDNITINTGKKIDYATELILKSSASSRQSFKVENAINLDPDWETPAGTTNVLAIKYNGGEIEIFDSGGKGGSTFDNIHENAANVTIGPGPAGGPSGVSNLTINTYESNVLTVTGNISADNITIGALHVAASPFNLDDVCSSGAGANVTSNIVQFTGTSNAVVITNNIKIGADVHIGADAYITNDVLVTGNAVSQNLQLTNTQIASSFTTGTGTLTIDCKNKSYGTAPLTTIDADVAILSISNLPSGGQVVVPLLASGSDRKVLKTITSGIDFIAFTTDVSIAQSGHGLLTVSKIGASGAEKIYMNAIAFTAA